MARVSRTLLDPHLSVLLGRLHSSPPGCESAEPQVHSGTNSGQEQPDLFYSKGCTICTCTTTASFLLSCTLSIASLAVAVLSKEHTVVLRAA